MARVEFSKDFGHHSSMCSTRKLLSATEMNEVELISSGSLHPLTGFMHQEEFMAVTRTLKLLNGDLFLTPLVLGVESVSSGYLTTGDCIQLVDHYANHIGEVSIEAIFPYPGRATMLAVAGQLTLSSVSNVIAPRVPSVMYSITDARREVSQRKRSRVIVFQSRIPPSNGSLARLLSRLNETDLLFVIQTITEPSEVSHFSYGVLSSIYVEVMSYFQKSNIDIIISHLSLPKRHRADERLFLQLKVAKYLGATEVLVHMHPDLDEAELVHRMTTELNISVELVCESREFSDSLRMLMDEGKSQYLEGVVDEPVHRVLRSAYPPLHQRGLVVMFVGLSGSGKTTHAIALGARLRSKRVTLLDGDAMRAIFSPDLGYDLAARWTHIRRMKFIASEIMKHRGTVIVSTVAPLREMRLEFRNAIVHETNSNFFLVHVGTSLAECSSRDSKGLYARAQQNETMEGLSSPFDSLNEEEPHVWVNGIGGSKILDQNVDRIMTSLLNRGYLHPKTSGIISEPDTHDEI